MFPDFFIDLFLLFQEKTGNATSAICQGKRPFPVFLLYNLNATQLVLSQFYVVCFVVSRNVYQMFYYCQEFMLSHFCLDFKALLPFQGHFLISISELVKLFT